MIVLVPNHSKHLARSYANSNRSLLWNGKYGRIRNSTFRPILRRKHAPTAYLHVTRLPVQLWKYSCPITPSIRS